MLNLKRAYKEISYHWDLKAMVKQLVTVTLTLSIFVGLMTRSVYNDDYLIHFYFYFLLPMFLLLPPIIMCLHWYFELRIKYDNYYRKIETLKKYQSLLNKFNKTN